MIEDQYVTPAEWQRHLLPRRGGRPVPYTPEPGAAKVVAAALQDEAGLRGSLAHAKTPADVAAAGLAQLDGDPAATALGAAAVAAFVVGPQQHTDARTSRAIADEWVRTRGLAFAVRAGAELADLRCISRQEQRYGEVFAAPVTRFGAGQAPQHIQGNGVALLLNRLRVATAAASDEDYAAAVRALGELRAAGPALHQAVVASFLAPTEESWVRADAGAVVGRRGTEWLQLLLTTCVTRSERLRPLLTRYVSNHLTSSPEYVFTVAEGLGADGLEAFLELLSSNAAWGDGVRLLLTAISAVPSDEAFLALVERSDSKAGSLALGEAADRFPRRAIRLLATASGSGARAVLLGELLRTQVIRHRAAADEVLAALPEAAARRVSAITARVDAVHEAPPEAVPPLLAAPPWTAGGKPRKPIVVAGLECTDPFELRWAEGEREAGLQARQGYRSYGRRDFDTLEREIRAGRARSYDEVGFFEAAPEALAAPLLENWRPKEFWNAEFWLPALVARYGLLALPAVLAGAPSAAAAVAQALQPVTGPPVAPLMAEYFGRLKTVRPTAAAWLRRHPEAAARGLVPVALGKAGAPRRYAERALYYLAGEGHTGAIRAAAQWYGPAAAEGIAALLDADPVQLLPARMPVVPDWVEPALLAPIELVGGAGSLPDAAARSVLTILAMSRLGEPYAGLAVVTETCTARSLAEFAWSLFQRWQVAGYPSKESWVLDALGFLGDDDTVRRLAPLIRAWPGESGHARAVAGLDVLAEIGTDVALMHLHGISEKVKFRGLKEKAQEKIAEVADALGLSPEQLADRLVPDFGLEPDGTLVLDYGSRAFVVGFDEQLKPYVAGEDGKRRKDLPKPGAKDDPQLAPAAAARFAALKKDVRTVAADQIRRFERAMVWQRRWKPDEFRQFIVEHPLVWHVARRLVWAAYPAGDPAGAALMSLRVAEDRTLAGADDEPTAIPDGALIGVAHPLQLGADLAAWGEVFADYEILQPFEQLSRAAQALTEAERTATQLTRQAGVKVPTTRVLGLERRGWRRAAPEDAGVQPAMERDLPGGDVLMLDLDPGIVVGLVTEFEHQTLGPAFILPQGSFTWNRPKGRPLSSLDPVTASEILRDLAEVTQ
ncbi:DUF4132 domain-containing protein [Dactylosporangium matsuzakiense]|uniref:DUF4132 domain-containing protein n=1 Tax=Dactylosporangium matsuzakiense TaxID=53360 RepID=A0A9W6KA70_9ACTN|nr:DUF4132 domain-containing protein [Dactylosporangium matsuzakiense]UWZ47194.1 DUF4132 domain-containing protein [Dactylosporangium matsuzakiense]GLK98365.1 hypothetical protein GCM10017581_001060 [Dactylosporangium matsuzakiense]